MGIFIDVVLPVILIFVVGYVVQKWKRMDIKSISTVAIYIMTPCLIFNVFYDAVLDFNYLYMVIFSMVLLYGIIFINKLYVKIKKYDQSTESGLILSTAFMNSGNYGAPIILFAYGELGFAYSISFMVLQAIIMNFYGIYYAARGQASVSYAFKSVLKMPATYAVIVALFMNLTSVSVPANFMSAIDLVAAATIPTVMLILGMQLAEIKWSGFDWGKITYGTVTRLVISPILAFIIILLSPFELDPVLVNVLIVSAAMPAAATTTMYAVQFNSEPKLVSSITLVTTAISVLTITLLLTVLQ
ncbi:AEC family transporter [Bacillus sp. FJAT-45350]|uniref:AEC family transporter n=1 Tax=Bacillus sp. FJAT-45350 TaxID=2011014 RepID=UPI000BB98F41|nr:AEC family transporter [Bacillus sp. FJAT-45350]